MYLSNLYPSQFPNHLPSGCPLSLPSGSLTCDTANLVPLIYSNACTSNCSHVCSGVCDWRITCLLLSDLLSKPLVKYSIVEETIGKQVSPLKV